jgi:3',5'-cyclic-nucleotide phosphodiesterase
MITGYSALPILDVDNTALGVIVVFNKRNYSVDPRCVFTTYDEFSLKQISKFSSNAYRTSRSIQIANDSRDRMEMLVGMIKQIGSESDSVNVIDKMFQMSKSILNATGITLFEIVETEDDKLGETMLKISKATIADAIGMLFSIDEGIAGYVARTGETLNIKDCYNDYRFNPQADISRGFKTNSLLCVPVFQQNRVVAVIQAVNKRVGKFFSQDDEHLLQYLSESTGISLSQAALLHQVIHDRRQAMIDKIFIEVLSKRCSTHRFVINVMNAAHYLLDMQRFSLYLVDHHHKEVWVTVEEENIICVPLGVGIAGHVAETGTNVMVDDAYDFPLFQKDIDKSTGFRTKSVLCMPVYSKDNVIIGVVQGINRLNARGEIITFNADDMKVMGQFCQQLSVVLRQMMMEASITKMNVDRKSALDRKSSMAVPVFALANEYRTSLASETKYSYQDTTGWVLPDEYTDDDVDNNNDASVAHIVKSNSWDIDVLAMSDLEMMQTFEICLDQFQLLERHDLDSKKIQTFIGKIASCYNNNPYHNFHHAFHVFHSVHCILKSKTIGFLSSQNVLSALIAAVCHDIDHPGHNNAFEKESRSDLAILYSDDSILERHHCAVTFKIMKDDDCNLLGGLSKESYDQCRTIIVKAILTTDMSMHAELSRTLNAMADDTFETMSHDSNSSIYNTFFSAILHTGDLSGQAIPLRLALKWGDRVILEFKNQAKKETALGMTVAPFMANLENPARAANVQKGYIDFILKPWWVQFMRFFPDNADLQLGLSSINEVREFYAEASNPDAKNKEKKELKARMEKISIEEKERKAETEAGEGSAVKNNVVKGGAEGGSDEQPKREESVEK